MSSSNKRSTKKTVTVAEPPVTEAVTAHDIGAMNDRLPTFGTNTTPSATTSSMSTTTTTSSQPLNSIPPGPSSNLPVPGSFASVAPQIATAAILAKKHATETAASSSTSTTTSDIPGSSSTPNASAISGAISSLTGTGLPPPSSSTTTSTTTGKAPPTSNLKPTNEQLAKQRAEYIEKLELYRKWFPKETELYQPKNPNSLSNEQLLALCDLCDSALSSDLGRDVVSTIVYGIMGAVDSTLVSRVYSWRYYKHAPEVAENMAKDPNTPFSRALTRLAIKYNDKFKVSAELGLLIAIAQVYSATSKLNTTQGLVEGDEDGYRQYEVDNEDTTASSDVYQEL